MVNRERLNQKARTREALLAGARALMERGQRVTVSAAAAESGVSKATAYRYFSDPSVLAVEAGLDVKVRPVEEIVSGARTARERAVRVSLYLFEMATENEQAFRLYLARYLDGWAKDRHRMTRGGRRMRMFATALEEERPRLPPDRFDALVRALAVGTGTEAMIALYDVAQADPEVARETVATMADAVLDRFLGPQLGGTD